MVGDAGALPLQVPQRPPRSKLLCVARARTRGFRGRAGRGLLTYVTVWYMVIRGWGHEGC